MAKYYDWKDYYIPGTEVLRNLFISPGKPYGETDPGKLELIANALVGERMRTLAAQPIRAILILLI